MADFRPDRPDVITLSIPSRLELLSLLDQLTDSISSRIDFTDEERSAISLSVVEAGTNAIQHGHKADGITPVDVRHELTRTSWWSWCMTEARASSRLPTFRTSRAPSICSTRAGAASSSWDLHGPGSVRLLEQHDRAPR
jgi:anti-sigma regulatory factor (Ser/Thr protein kinase)